MTTIPTTGRPLSARQTAVLGIIARYPWSSGMDIVDVLAPTVPDIVGPEGVHQTAASLRRRKLIVRESVKGTVRYALATPAVIYHPAGRWTIRKIGADGSVHITRMNGSQTSYSRDVWAKEYE